MMTRIHWTEVIIKILLGIQIVSFMAFAPALITTIAAVATLLDMQELASPWFPPIAALLLIFIPGVVVLVIWRKAHFIAEWLWKDAPIKEEGSYGSITYTEARSLLVGGLGLYFLLVSLPGFLEGVASLIGSRDLRAILSVGGLLLLDDFVELVGDVLVMAIALVFLVTPRRVRSLLGYLWSPYTSDRTNRGHR